MDEVNSKHIANLINNEVTPEIVTHNGYAAENNAVGALASGGENLKRSSLSWKGVNVFAALERPSICKRLCAKEANNEPGIKQILFDGK